MSVILCKAITTCLVKGSIEKGKLIIRLLIISLSISFDLATKAFGSFAV